MPMPTIDSIQTALSAISTFLIMEGATLSPDLRDALVTSSGRPSPVDRIVEVSESLYSHADYLSDGGKLLCAGLMTFATMNGWHGLSVDNRGPRIAQAMQRDAGETAPFGMSWPDPETDPAPKAPVVVAEPTPVPPAPVGSE
ncbi:hypothetical protein [uncultured Sphingobium sp.]|uniref:hypothetical protein n=1 Tax=uncultured Sphingobium sp. TaxID=316087 RepID=UPI00259B904D|nr:hypothetical protein [uncultured Sphingobium sp.]